VDRIFGVGVSKEAVGVGLGLPIARRIIQRYGGSLLAEAAEGGQFLLDLPPHT
jgi:signal transduction histidine kinase